MISENTRIPQVARGLVSCAWGSTMSNTREVHALKYLVGPRYRRQAPALPVVRAAS